MDFEFDERSTGAKSSSSERKGSSHGSSSSLASNRSRRRQRQEKISPKDDFEFASSSEAPKAAVRGAGASAFAVQDAGTYQMLHDECAFLCSTMISSRNPTQAIEAAIDLAELLSARKTRAVLWQGDNDTYAAAITQSQDSLSGDDDADAEHDDDADDHHDDEHSKNNSKNTNKNNSTILQSILDVLSAVTQAPTTNTGNSTTVSISISRKNRTQSARRKKKQPRLHTSTPSNTSLPSTSLAPQMRQALASILYFLSWDCTMSEQHSVAVIGSVKSYAVARQFRRTILEHSTALQGAMRLVLTDSFTTQTDGGGESIASLSSSLPSNPAARTNNNNNTPTRSFSQSSNGSYGSSIPSAVDTLGRRATPLTTMSVPVPTKEVSFSDASLESSDPFSFDQQHASTTTTKTNSGDPTAAGRRKRRTTRRKRVEEMEYIPEDALHWPDTKIIPPARTSNIGDTLGSAGSTRTMRLSFASDDNSNSDQKKFVTPKSPPKTAKTEPVHPTSPTGSSVTSCSAATTFTTTKINQKLQALTSQVVVTSTTEDLKTPVDHSAGCAHHGEHLQRLSWAAYAALQSIDRIVTGKGEGSESCLEGAVQENEKNGDNQLDGEDENPILMTNNLLGKSGVIPLMARCMSQSLRAAVNVLDDDGQAQAGGCIRCLSNSQERISLLASLIDGACLWNEDNRVGLCDDDPFSFHEQNEGLVFHLLLLLKRLCMVHGEQSSLEQWSDVMLAALRTLTSLTHENKLAAEQVVMRNECDDDMNEHDRLSFRGSDVLAELLYQLEGNGDKAALQKGTVFSQGDEKHRYDSTVFCLNTLANIVLEEENIRRLLAELKIPCNLESGEKSWLKWLCRWLVNQTESFQDAVLGSDRDEKASASARNTARVLKNQEEDRLVAAGNGCVLLACLITEPDAVSEEPDSTTLIRQAILEEMPRNQDGTTTGVTLIINTLKAFCNFYHYSLGDLSVAIVTPVKKLIDELEQIQAGSGSE
jgi:hypothetical protein